MHHSHTAQRLILLFLCSEALIACGHATSTGAGQGVSEPGLCAFQIENSRVTARDIDGGEAIDFTTQSEHVAEVRRKVHSIAAVYNHHPCGDPIDGSAAARAEPRSVDVHPDVAMPPVDASVEEIDGGARLLLRPQHPADLAALRERARQRSGQIEDGQCEPAQTSGS